MQQGLSDFFKTGNVAALVGAYRSYNNTSGFIKAVMQHRKSEGLKEFPEIEYEIKFDITPLGKGKELTRKIDVVKRPEAKKATKVQPAYSGVGRTAIKIEVQ